MDDMLERLVNSVEKGDLKLGITIQVSGLLVSGILVNRKEFMQLLAQAFRKGTSDENRISEDVYEGFLAGAGEVQDEMKQRAGRASREPLQYLHLRDVEIYDASTRIRLVFWRGRLESVDAWTIGISGDR